MLLAVQLRRLNVVLAHPKGVLLVYFSPLLKI